MTQRIEPDLIRRFYDAFYGALAAHRPERFADFLTDDVDWVVLGPVDVFPYCGRHLGKTEVAAIYRKFSGLFDVVGYAPEYLLADGDTASALIRFTARQQSTGRTISYRLAHFMRFRDGRIAEFRCLLDTLDAAEQVLGHRVDLFADPALAGAQTPAPSLAVDDLCIVP